MRVQPRLTYLAPIGCPAESTRVFYWQKREKKTLGARRTRVRALSLMTSLLGTRQESEDIRSWRRTLSSKLCSDSRNERTSNYWSSLLEFLNHLRYQKSEESVLGHVRTSPFAYTVCTRE